MSEVTMTVAVRELPAVKTLVNELVRVRDEIDTAVRGILGDSPHIGEGVEQRWPQMRIVRLDDTFAEIRIGGAAWTIRLDQWDDATKFLEHVRHLWDMRVVWADSGTPVDSACALSILKENQRFRDALEKIEGGEGCSTPSYGDCCDMACARLARATLATEQHGSDRKDGS